MVSNTSPNEVTARAQSVSVASEGSSDGICQRETHARAALLAKVTTTAQWPAKKCADAACDFGFGWGTFFDARDAHGFWFRNAVDSVVVCRTRWDNDPDLLKQKLGMQLTKRDLAGRCHQGISELADQIWPQIELAMVDDRKDLWFTGFGVGGAVATLCAHRYLLSANQNEPREVHSFGAPRWGDPRLIRHLQVPIYRWVIRNDPLPGWPPAWRGFRHGGKERRLPAPATEGNQHAMVVPLQFWKRLLRVTGVTWAPADQCDASAYVKALSQLAQQIGRRN